MNRKAAAAIVVSFFSGSIAVSLIASSPILSFVSAGTDGTSLETLPVSEATPQKPLTLFLAGDVLLTRAVGSAMRKNGPDVPFGTMRTVITSCDIAFANLETPLGFKGSPYPGKPESVTFRGDPSAAIALRYSGFDVVSIANNHMNDYGPACVRETIQYLGAAGLSFAGAGSNAEEAYAPSVLVSNGKTIAFLAFAEPIWSVVEAGDSPGVAITRTESVLAAIRKTKTSVKPDVLVVSFHWGDEYSHRPKDDQRNLAHAAIDEGADIIAGHHPHVLQGVEKYGSGVIFYSLGNFAFDMKSPLTYDSMYAIVTIQPDGRIGAVQVSAALIDRTTYSPAPARTEDGTRILQSIAAWSSTLGTPCQFDQNSLAF